MIHPTAIVDPRAEIDASAEVGPFAVIEGRARVGARTRIDAHAVITGGTEIGADNRVHAGAVLGDVPQDVAFTGAESFLRIGDGNVFRENSTIHRGTKPESETRIGDRNYFMQNSHVAHNCSIGDDAIVAGGAMLSGYVELGDRGIRAYNLREQIEFQAHGRGYLGPFAQEPATSWAAPHLAGVAARILSLRPGLKPFEMKTILYWLFRSVQNK